MSKIGCLLCSGTGDSVTNPDFKHEDNCPIGNGEKLEVNKPKSKNPSPSKGLATMNPKNIDSQLDRILKQLAPAHDDDDHKVCSSNYSQCSICLEKVYQMNVHYHTKHTPVPVWKPYECDCTVGKEIEEAKQAIKDLFQTAEAEAYKKGYIDGGIGVINGQE